MNLRCRVPRGAAPLLLTEGVQHESLPHRLPGLDRDFGVLSVILTVILNLII